MAITLRAETQQQIENQMKAGGYASADDVIEAGLRLLEERERQTKEDLVRVRQKIAVGLEQLDRGEGLDGEAVFEELLAELDRDGENP